MELLCTHATGIRLLSALPRFVRVVSLCGKPNNKRLTTPCLAHAAARRPETAFSSSSAMSWAALARTGCACGTVWMSDGTNLRRFRADPNVPAAYPDARCQGRDPGGRRHPPHELPEDYQIHAPG